MFSGLISLENEILNIVGNTIETIDAAIMEPLRPQIEKTLIYVIPGTGLDAKLIQGANMIGIDAMTFKVGSWCSCGAGYIGCVCGEERKGKVIIGAYVSRNVIKMKCIKFFPE